MNKCKLILMAFVFAVPMLFDSQSAQAQSPTLAVRDDGPPRERVLAFQAGLNQLAETNRLRLLEAIKLRRASKDEAICEYLAMKYGSEANIETATGDQFMKWIEWIIANQDSIIKFVTTLIDMFGTTTKNAILVSYGGVKQIGYVGKHRIWERRRNFDTRVAFRLVVS